MSFCKTRHDYESAWANLQAYLTQLNMENVMIILIFLYTTSLFNFLFLTQIIGDPVY
jgi:hypothetical protein